MSNTACFLVYAPLPYLVPGGLRAVTPPPTRGRLVVVVVVVWVRAVLGRLLRRAGFVASIVRWILRDADAVVGRVLFLIAAALPKWMRKSIYFRNLSRNRSIPNHLDIRIARRAESLCESWTGSHTKCAAIHRQQAKKCRRGDTRKTILQ